MAALCEEEGTGRVYVDFVNQIARRVASRGHSMQMWADIVMQHADVVGELPEDVTLLLWGYEADHPFEEECQQVAAAGKPFYVCPGTSAWNAIAGRTTNMIGNLIHAAQAGRAGRSAGTARPPPASAAAAAQAMGCWHHLCILLHFPPPLAPVAGGNVAPPLCPRAS